MVERIRDTLQFALLIIRNAPLEQFGEFYAHEWLSDPLNIAFRIGNDLGVFEHLGPGVYLGHCFFSSRGRLAKDHAKQMIDELPAGTRVIGEVPYWRRDVRLFMGSLGFVSVGQADRPMGKVIVMERKPELNRAPSHDRTTLSLA